MRCLALADALQRRGAQCLFISRAHPGNLHPRIENSGHRLTSLPAAGRGAPVEDACAHAAWLGGDWQEDARQTHAAISGQPPDWLIVDHYALDVHWENEMRLHSRRLMVIDDLADRSHECDLLLDQNLGREETDYASLIPTAARRLIGPRYALLRPEFASLREYSLVRRREPTLRRILVSMGGVDQRNATGLVLDALSRCALPRDCQVAVVMGKHAPWLNVIRAAAAKMPFACDVKVDVSDMAQIMADSDLAIGAAGSTSWERCAMGLPSIMVVLADNQCGIAEALDRAGAAILIGVGATESALAGAAVALCADMRTLAALSKAAARVVDGIGTSRVVSGLYAEACE